MQNDQNKEILLTIHRQAWDYFNLHSSQRIASFNYYITINTILIGALVASFQKDFIMTSIRPLLGLLIVIISYVFYKLDERNRELINYSEDALRFFEGKLDYADGNGRPSQILIFSREKWDKSNGLRKSWSYAIVFRAIFIAFAIVGAVGTIISIYYIIKKSN